MHRRELLEWMGSAALLVLGCGDEERRSVAPSPPAPPPEPHAPEPPPEPAPAAPSVTARPASDADWARFGAALDGRLVRPSAAEYDVARRLFDPRFDSIRPAGIAYCASESDVQRAITFARAHALPFATRCGGHSYAGYSSGPGLVCDVSPLSAVRVDPRTQTASVGAGARLVDVYAAVAAHGAIPGGTCASVGIAGLTLGGGQGVLGRKLGLTCDSVSAMRIVTADGRARACDEAREADLFWACRGGGGGNFGVVTSFTFRVHPIAQLTRFSLPWRWAAARDVVAAWQEWGPRAPDELWSKCEIGASAGSASISMAGVYVGSPSALTAELARLEARVGSPPRRRRIDSAGVLDTMLAQAGCAHRTIEECHLRDQSPAGTLGRGIHLSRSDVFDRPLSSAGIDALIAGMEERSELAEGSGRVGLDALGGAINRIAPDATAFVHRGSLFVAQYAAYWRQRASPEVVAASSRWLDRLYGAMRPHASGFAYQNYIDPSLTDWAGAYYGANLPRLSAIQARHDPDGLFRFAQSIPAA